MVQGAGSCSGCWTTSSGLCCSGCKCAPRQLTVLLTHTIHTSRQHHRAETQPTGWCWQAAVPSPANSVSSRSPVSAHWSKATLDRNTSRSSGRSPASSSRPSTSSVDRSGPPKKLTFCGSHTGLVYELSSSVCLETGKRDVMQPTAMVDFNMHVCTSCSKVDRRSEAQLGAKAEGSRLPAGRRTVQLQPDPPLPWLAAPPASRSLGSPRGWRGRCRRAPSPPGPPPPRSLQGQGLDSPHHLSAVTA